MSDKAILYDSSRCTGCKGCQVACKTWNNLPSPTRKNENEFTGSYQSPLNLNSATRLLMSFHEEEGGDKGIQWAFGRRSCQHCGDAPCAQVCPSGCLYRHESGLVSTKTDVCIGCQRCAAACPFDVPRYRVSDGRINKCTGCVDRIEQGRTPACVFTCQPGALQFGERDEMIQQAQERVDILHKRGYTDAAAYGQNEVGGLHVIQVLKHGVEAHGQIPHPSVSPVVGLTELMKPLTGVATGVTVVGLAAMYMLNRGYHRDTMVYNPATEDTLNAQTGEVLKHGDGEDAESIREHLNLGDRKGGDHDE